MRLWLIVTFAFQFDAKAIGSGSEGAQQSLQEVWIFWNYIPENISPCNSNLLLGLPQEHDPKGGHKVCFHHPEAGAHLIDELLNFSLTIKDELQKCALAARHSHVPLLQVMEEKLNETNVEAARVTPQGGFQMIKGEELESIIKELAWVLLCAAVNQQWNPIHVGNQSPLKCVRTVQWLYFNLFLTLREAKNIPCENKLAIQIPNRWVITDSQSLWMWYR